MSPEDRELVRAMIQQGIANAIGYRVIAKSSSLGQKDAVEAHALESSDPKAQDETRRMETWGVRSVPPPGVASLVVRSNGGPSNGVMVACGSDKYGPDDLDDGETAVYCKETDVEIILAPEGVTITAGLSSVTVAKDKAIDIQAGLGAAVNITAGVGANVVLNNGQLNVARASQDTAGAYPIVGGNPFVKA